MGAAGSFLTSIRWEPALIGVLSTAAVLLAAAGFPALSQDARGALRCRVTLSRELAPGGASGRLLVLMSDAAGKPSTLRVGFVPGSTWISAPCRLATRAAGAASAT